jgi:hypothetical protein
VSQGMADRWYVRGQGWVTGTVECKGTEESGFDVEGVFRFEEELANLELEEQILPCSLCMSSPLLV